MKTIADKYEELQRESRERFQRESEDIAYEKELIRQDRQEMHEHILEIRRKQEQTDIAAGYTAPRQYKGSIAEGYGIISAPAPTPVSKFSSWKCLKMVVQEIGYVLRDINSVRW